MKPILLLIALAVGVVGCSGAIPSVGGPYIPPLHIPKPTPPPAVVQISPSFRAGSDVQAAHGSNGVYISSFYITEKIGHHKYNGYVNYKRPCWLTYLSNGKAKGCYLIWIAKNAVISESAGQYTKLNAQGCLAATGSYSGPVYTGQPIPITWYQTRNRC